MVRLLLQMQDGLLINRLEKQLSIRLNAFLTFNERDILENAGSVANAVADQLASNEYEKYNQHRLLQNSPDDFEEFIKKKGLDK